MLNVISSEFKIKMAGLGGDETGLGGEEETGLGWREERDWDGGPIGGDIGGGRFVYFPKKTTGPIMQLPGGIEVFRVFDIEAEFSGKQNNHPKYKQPAGYSRPQDWWSSQEYRNQKRQWDDQEHELSRQRSISMQQLSQQLLANITPGLSSQKFLIYPQAAQKFRMSVKLHTSDVIIIPVFDLHDNRSISDGSREKSKIEQIVEPIIRQLAESAGEQMVRFEVKEHNPGDVSDLTHRIRGNK